MKYVKIKMYYIGGCSNMKRIDFNKMKGFICDMDGVIYHGNKILPGVVEFINWLQQENKELREMLAALQ